MQGKTTLAKAFGRQLWADQQVDSAFFADLKGNSIEYTLLFLMVWACKAIVCICEVMLVPFEGCHATGSIPVLHYVQWPKLTCCTVTVRMSSHRLAVTACACRSANTLAGLHGVTVILCLLLTSEAIGICTAETNSVEEGLLNMYLALESAEGVTDANRVSS